MPSADAESGPSFTHRVHLPLTDDAAEVAAARLMAAGARGTWQRPDELIAWFDVRPERLGTDLDLIAEWQREDDRDWQAEWKATIGPVVAGRFTIVPSWLVDDHPADGTTMVLEIDPGRAFGTGHHATTTMCLELIDEFDQRHSLTGKRLADVGCGSGILAIAAVRLGAIASAVDTDPDAIAVTAENAELNHVTLSVAHGSVAALDGLFDVVVANIVTDVIAELAQDLTNLVSPGGTLIVSGISEQRSAIALDPLAQLGWQVERTIVRDKWVGARLRR